jgi:protein transport protein SEC20
VRRPPRAAEKTPQSAAVAANNDVTASLRQTHALLASEVARSEFAARALADSTAALEELSTRYGDLGGQLQRSGRMLGALLRAHHSDTWYLETAFWLLAVTAGWLVFRRLLYGPLWLLVWFPVRTVFRTGSAAVGWVGSGEKGASMVVSDPLGGTARVVGIGEEGAVPTADVGGASAREKEKGDPDSMVEKVGRIVDGEEQDGDVAEAEGQPNPKKRMWEEEKEAAKEAERVKDEL